LCLIGCALLAAQHVQAQAFPSKNIQMVMPHTAGGSIDLFSRVMAQQLPRE
jgi:tripartite-type tricarboxylate transporter receptor subunit TctC